MPSPANVPPEQSDAVSLADWVELALLINGRQKMSRTSMRVALKEFLSDDTADLGFILGEIDQRRRVIGDAYPYAVSRSSVVRSTPANRWYDFLLIASHPNTSFRRTKTWSEVNDLFDRATLLALKQYLGPSSEGVIFSWPVNGERPSQFPEAIAWLAERLNLPVGGAHLSPHKKDGGVDVVAWRAFKDRRSAFTAILAQCTVRSTYSPKARDIVTNHWANYIGFGAHPQTSLAVPFVVPETSDDWDNMHYSVQVLLDRLRLAHLLSDVPDLADVETWISAEVEASAA